MAFRTFDAPPETTHKNHKSPKPVVRPAAVFLVMLFVFTLLILQGRAFYDLNRMYNPNYSSCVGESTVEQSCDEYYYNWNRALAWSYVSFPLLFVYLMLALVLRKKKNVNWQKAFHVAFSFLSAVVAGTIFTYVSIFLFQFHRMLAWYVLFGTAAVLLVVMVIFIDKKHRKQYHVEEEDEH